MKFGEIQKLGNTLLNANDIEIEVNTIYNEETGEWDASEICEVHYDEKKNKIFITPSIIAILRRY